MNGQVFKVVKFATDVTTRVQNVETLATALNAMSEGDMTQTIAKPFLPALDKLRADYNETSSKLRNTLQSILGNAGAIASASQQIQQASSELASAPNSRRPRSKRRQPRWKRSPRPSATAASVPRRRVPGAQDQGKCRAFRQCRGQLRSRP